MAPKDFSATFPADRSTLVSSTNVVAMLFTYCGSIPVGLTRLFYHENSVMTSYLLLLVGSSQRSPFSKKYGIIQWNHPSTSKVSRVLILKAL